MKFNFNKQYLHEYIYKQGFKNYTNIQEKIIPLFLKNKNLIGVSQTGSGKTLSFLLPIFNKITSNNKCQVVIILPTRELARQINSEVNKLTEYEKDITSKLIIGGEDNDKKISDFIKKPSNILITTPEKFLLINSMSKKIFLDLSTIVFDEADMLIDLGFLNSFIEILNVLDDNVQKVAFSATLHDMLANKIRLLFKNCEIVDVSTNIWTNKNIFHYLIHYSNNKREVFEELLSKINPFFCIIFANTKKDLIYISEILKNKKINYRELHGDIPSRKRKNIFNELKNHDVRYLLCTDLASRGIDIDGVSDIISWNLPKEDVWYIHRAGRTGRGKYKGNSYVFLDNDSLKQVLRLKNKKIYWINLKYKNHNFNEFDYKFREHKSKRQNTEVDKKIKDVINSSSKKVKPNYKKKIKIKIDKIKQKEKRKAIDASMKKALIKKYKIENANKNKKDK